MITIPSDAIEPVAPALRQDFDLAADETQFLLDEGRHWELVALHEGGGQSLWLFVLDVTLPNGFVSLATPGDHLASVTVGIRVTGYPTSALDMVYVHPPVGRADGRPIPGVSPLTIDSRDFQQWSRHYSFHVGADSIESHFRAAENWFIRAAQP